MAAALPVAVLLHDFDIPIYFDPNITIAAENFRSIEIEGKIREVMMKAFWDGVVESMEGDEPQYDRVVQLMKDVRDELCEIAPESWKWEIIESIDVDILSQSGNLEMDYLVRILEFALGILQKLSSPSSDNEMKTSHQQLIKELSEICDAKDISNNPHAIAMVRGLRFVLDQIQAGKIAITEGFTRYTPNTGPKDYSRLHQATTQVLLLPEDKLHELSHGIHQLQSQSVLKEKIEAMTVTSH